MATRKSTSKASKRKSQGSSKRFKSSQSAKPSQSAKSAVPTPTDKTERVANVSSASNYIPEDVSRRMIRRVVLFSGIPTFMGLGSFFVNYYILTQTSIDLPPYFTLVETLLLFGFGFLGISYGVLSASWDTDPGSRVGFSEFRSNLGNLIQQWRDYGDKKRQQSKSD